MSVFGPVLPFDLVRMARRGRYVLLRCLYGLALLALLYLTYSNHVISRRDGWADPRELANFAERFFFVFMAAQYVLVLLLTPAYVGDSIAGEKQRRTLDYLLTTQLSIREIVLAKLTSRLAGVGLFLLAGLPVLSVTLLFGGVSPELLLGGFVATLLTMLSLAAVALCMSVSARQPRDAILLTYLVVLCYFVFWWLLGQARDYVAREFGPGSGPVTVVQEVRAVYNAGNLYAVMEELQRALAAGRSYAAVLPGLLGKYAVFHGAIALACTVWAMLRLRRVFATTTLGTVKPRKERLWKRPRVGDQPMLWKEVHAEPGFRLGGLGTVLLVLLALACLVPPVIIVLEYADTGFLFTTWARGGNPRSTYPTLGDRMNPYVRVAGTLLACVALLAVVVRAAGSVGAERDKQTLDGLLASLLGDKEILRAKWLGSVLCVRWLLGLLGVIWLLGVFTGGLHPFALIVLPLVFAVYAAFMASLGLTFAAWSKTTLRAVMGATIAAALVGLGPWVCVWLAQGVFTTGGLYWLSVPLILFLSIAYAALLVTAVLLAFAAWMKTTMREMIGTGAALVLFYGAPPVFFVAALAVLSDVWGMSNVMDLVTLGLSPPLIIYESAFYAQDLRHVEKNSVLCAGAGVGIFAALAGLLWFAAADRFRRSCGRVDGQVAAKKKVRPDWMPVGWSGFSPDAGEPSRGWG